MLLITVHYKSSSPPGMPATSETATGRATARICRWRPLRLRRFAPVRWRTLKPCQYTRNLSQFMRSTTSLSQPMNSLHHLHPRHPRGRNLQLCTDPRLVRRLWPRPPLLPPTYLLQGRPGEAGSKAPPLGDQRPVVLTENQKY